MIPSAPAFSPARTRQRTCPWTARFGERCRTVLQPLRVDPIGSLLDGVRGWWRQRGRVSGRAAASEDDDGIGGAGADGRLERTRCWKVGRLPVERAHAVLPPGAKAFAEELALRGEIRLVGLFGAALGQLFLAGEGIAHEPEHARRGRQNAH
jgi:hypothetical protein